MGEIAYLVGMDTGSFIKNVWGRNLLGILALFAAYGVSDQYHLPERVGPNRWLPYVFLLTLYGWLVFHHRILFDRLYLRGKKQAYLAWLLLALTLSSLNMHYILRVGFGVSRTLPHLVGFWVYTLTGLGVYVLFRHFRPALPLDAATDNANAADKPAPSYLSCVIEGQPQAIPYATILYVESLENYVKVHTTAKVYLTRLTLKQVEERLPRPAFVRISKSHLIHLAYLEEATPDVVKVGGNHLRIGKVYKRYVAEQLAAKS